MDQIQHFDEELRSKTFFLLFWKMCTDAHNMTMNGPEMCIKKLNRVNFVFMGFVINS